MRLGPFVVFAVVLWMVSALVHARYHHEDPCPGYVLASGTLSAAEHELADGYASIQTFTLHAPPQSTAVQVFRQFAGKNVDVVIRSACPQPKLER